MKRYDYYWERVAVQITGVVFLSQVIFEVGGIGTRKVGFEWVLPACGLAFAAAVLWTVVKIVVNALEARK